MVKTLENLRRHVLVVAVLVFTASLYFVWTGSDTIGQLGNDGPAYLMMAEHYSPFGAPDPVHAVAATYSRFPPLYSLLLAWTGSAHDLRRAHAVTTCCLLLALLQLYIWLRAEGIPANQSALLILLFGALPGSWLAGLNIQSEYLYLFFSLLALTLMSAYRRQARSELLYGAALALGAATLTRSVGVTLLVPLLVVLWSAPRRVALRALIIALLPLLGWHLVHRPDIGYGGALTSIYGSNAWDALRKQLVEEFPALHNGFGGNFLRTPALRPLADALGLLCLGSAAWRAIRLMPDGIYLVAHLAVLLIWPYPEEAQRFLWVLVPLLLGQGLLSMAELRRTAPDIGPPSPLVAAGAGALLVMILPTVTLAADRYRSASFSELPEARGFVSWYATDQVYAEWATTTQVTLIYALRAIADYVPASDCVIATRPDLVNYFGQRRSEYPPLNSVPEPEFTGAIRQSGCHYVFGMNNKDGHFPVSLFPLLRLEPEIKALYVSTQASEAGGSKLMLASLALLRPAGDGGNGKP